MPTDDKQVLVTGIASAPCSFLIPGNGQIRPKTIYAKYNGAGAAGIYQPALKIISDSGNIVGIYPVASPIPAGNTVQVNWFHGADL